MVINKEEISNIDLIKLQKMTLLYNALEKGWSIRKSNDSYIFTKKHENKREIFQEDYLENFLLTNSTNVLGISSQL